MNQFAGCVIALLLLSGPGLSSLAKGQTSIAADEIAELDAKLVAAGKSASSARKKLAIRRVIREDGLPGAHHYRVQFG